MSFNKTLDDLEIFEKILENKAFRGLVNEIMMMNIYNQLNKR